MLKWTTGAPVTTTYYNQFYKRAPRTVIHGITRKRNEKLVWFEEVKQQFSSIQPDIEHSSQKRDCHALFTTSPFEPFTWLMIACNQTFSEVDVICTNNTYAERHQAGLLNVQVSIKEMLDIYANQCLEQGGLMLKSKCILFIPVKPVSNENIKTSYICSEYRYRNVESISAEELITSLLETIAHSQIFSYIIVHKEICQVLKAVKELGLHKVILKWTREPCGSFAITSNTTLIVCEFEFVSKDKQNDTFGCGFDNVSCKNGTCLASTSLCDGQTDCMSGEDEINCTDIVKVGNQTCKDGKVITAEKLCNLIPDCTHGDDEDNCFHVTNGCTNVSDAEMDSVLILSMYVMDFTNA